MSNSNRSISTSPGSSSAARNSSATSNTSGNKQRGGKTVKQQGTPAADREDISLLKKALTPGNYADWRKDEALDVFWWLKQIVAVILGITLGIFRITGWLGFALFAAVQFLAATAWAERAQIVGVFFDHFDILMENTLVALGTFLVGMIRHRSANHAQEAEVGRVEEASWANIQCLLAEPNTDEPACTAMRLKT